MWIIIFEKRYNDINYAFLSYFTYPVFSETVLETWFKLRVVLDLEY